MKAIALFFLTLIFTSTAYGQDLPRRGLFVSLIQEPPVLASRQDIQNLVDFAKKTGTQTLFVQIYRSNIAWFPSKVADSRPYEACRKDLAADPFRLLIKEAHAAGMEVHAWLNCLSLSANENAPLLKKYGPEILTRNLKEKKTLKDYKIDNQYFLEPGDLRVRETLSTVVGEILRAYPALDGIQFDYIRYPDKNPDYGYTQMNRARFKKMTGCQTIDAESPVWKDWKRAQVTDLLRTLVKKARAIRPNIQISTTGLMPYYRANLEAYQDWRYWLNHGIVDFVTLMCYAPDVPEFEKYISDAKKKMGDLSKVNIAVGAYRLLATPEIFEKQWDLCEDSGARACVTLHYGNLLQNPVLAKPLIRNKKS